ncbi:retrovirus-like pol polyprotein [Lasius niger]|uniref:Retrovirus-like pol polyprotein n=1 Tax=Lasius niger TaxID=67767 RepID=A0A0J7JX15_LASNI|nr:retrovirus-like pol polyprotein [Lasius niger]
MSNGLVENAHRPLKAVLKACLSERWTENLPTVLLGLRTVLREELGATTAELVYGTTLRLPGEFFAAVKEDASVASLLNELRSIMQTLGPRPTSNHGTRKTFVPQKLHTCTHVFIRQDHVKPPLTPPYEGPFPVLQRTDKTFKVLVKGKEWVISVGRLKPAFLLGTEEPPPVPNTPASPKQNTSASEAPETEAAVAVPKQTRSGRHVRFPARFLT